MNMEDIVVVCKESKLDYDKRTLRLTQAQIIEQYRREHADISNIIDSHNRQSSAYNHLTKQFAGARVVDHYQFTQEMAAKAKALIFFGGDDTFKAGSHLVRNKTPVVGMNSDPSESEGALLYFNYKQSDLVRDALLTPDFCQTEPWTRIDLSVNDHLVGRAISEVFLGAERRIKNSRMRMHLPNEQRHSAKGSGVLIYTGAGCTGWARSAGSRLEWPKTHPDVAWVETEKYHGRLQEKEEREDPSSITSAIKKITIESERKLNDDHTVTLDTLACYRDEQGRLVIDLSRILSKEAEEMPRRIMVKLPEYGTVSYEPEMLNIPTGGIIEPDECVIIYSTMNNDGLASVDSVNGSEASFNRGSVAKIKVSNKPLNVVTPAGIIS